MDPQLKKAVIPKLKQLWMYLEEPDLKMHVTFKKIIQVLKIINSHATKLYYTGGVSEHSQCKETTAKHVPYLVDMLCVRAT